MLLILVFSGASCSSLAARFKETEQTTESQETKETRTTKQNKQTKEILKTVWFLLPRGGLSIYIYIYIYTRIGVKGAILSLPKEAGGRGRGPEGPEAEAGRGGGGGRGGSEGTSSGPARGPNLGPISSSPLRKPNRPWTSKFPQ